VLVRWPGQPPSCRTSRPRVESKAIGANPAGGVAEGAATRHALPSHDQVSDIAPRTSSPPSRTMRPRAPSHAMPWYDRAEGDVPVDACVHVDPSHSHVSANSWRAYQVHTTPPNSTTRPRDGS